MPNTVLDNLAAEVTNITTVAESAVALINGIQGRIQAAVDAAVAGGATAAQLAPVQAEVDALHSEAAKLGDAVAANTPAPAPETPAA